jgi:hypothetical protein
MLSRLMLDVPQDGYTIREAENVLRAKVSAGASRQRLDQIGAPLEGDVQLFLDPLEYQYWRIFYRRRIMFGSLPFLMGLVIETAQVEDCEVLIIPGTYSNNIRGTAHLVQFQVEIKRPIAPSEEADESFLALFEDYGTGLGGLLDALEHLVNVELPESL